MGKAPISRRIGSVLCCCWFSQKSFSIEFPCFFGVFVVLHVATALDTLNENSPKAVVFVPGCRYLSCMQCGSVPPNFAHDPVKHQQIKKLAAAKFRQITVIQWAVRAHCSQNDKQVDETMATANFVYTNQSMLCAVWHLCCHTKWTVLRVY